jgi:hypothetical protein
MIARSAPPFTRRNILGRAGLASDRCRRDGGIRLNLWQRMFAALGAWSSASALAWRSEILLRDPPERFRRFCPDCEEDTPHEGFDELGAGWYAQICHCRHCGRQGMTVWPLGFW